MPERCEVRLGEYESVSFATDQLTARDVERLRHLEAKGRLALSTERGGWRLRAAGIVGVLVLDRLRVIFEPKFAVTGTQLMSWLSYALDVSVPTSVGARRWATALDGFADLLVTALLEECERLVREGLRRDYVRRDGVEPALRGRLDIASQAIRRYGQLDRLHVRTFDRETNIWDNRILGTALKEAVALAISPNLARDLHDVTSAFPRAATRGAALRALDHTQYTRLNARYRPAHIWAGLLLRGGGVTDVLSDEGAEAEGLLLAMPRLWEAVVRRLCVEAVAPHGGHAVPSRGATGISVRGDLGKPSVFKPDVLLSLAGGDGTTSPTLLPVDAKYKRYDRQGVSSNDVHQLLTYGTGYSPTDTPIAVIVHPQTVGFGARTMRIAGPRGALGVIRVLGIDTRVRPEQAAVWMSSELRAAPAGGRRR
jgi:5-methylcytosine-specific restriction enzyme subunit McrC